MSELLHCPQDPTPSDSSTRKPLLVPFSGWVSQMPAGVAVLPPAFGVIFIFLIVCFFKPISPFSVHILGVLSHVESTEAKELAWLALVVPLKIPLSTVKCGS